MAQKMSEFAKGYQACLADILAALEVDGEEGVREWVESNMVTEWVDNNIG